MSKQWKAVYSSYGDELWFGGNDGPGMWEIEGAEAYLPGDHDAQAHLIAAAPDMLAALEDMVAAFGWQAPNANPTVEAAVAAARKAITKAKGK